MSRSRSIWSRRTQILANPRRRIAAIAVALALVLAPLQTALAERTQLRPGWNMFTPEQDVQLGKEASQQAEKQVQLLNDRRVDDYLNRLGQRLASKAPGYKYPYSYRAVNDRAINAFALPGGPVYINRAIIEAADNEAQLAGVMAHETAHVALRHGTNQATKAQAWQMPLAILGAASGNGILAALTQLGASVHGELDPAEVFADRRDTGRCHGYADSVRSRLRSARDGTIFREAAGRTEGQGACGIFSVAPQSRQPHGARGRRGGQAGRSAEELHVRYLGISSDQAVCIDAACAQGALRQEGLPERLRVRRRLPSRWLRSRMTSFSCATRVTGRRAGRRARSVWLRRAEWCRTIRGRRRWPTA